MYVKAVGLRELKNRLSEYIRQVRAGEVVLVTDRGLVVAELKAPGEVPPDLKAVAGLLELAKRGLLSPGTPNDAGLYPRLPPRLSSSTLRALLDEERGSR